MAASGCQLFPVISDSDDWHCGLLAVQDVGELQKDASKLGASSVISVAVRSRSSALGGMCARHCFCAWL